MVKNKQFKKNIFEKLDLLKTKFNLQEDVVSTLKINNYTLLAFLFIGVIGIIVELLLFISLILMHTINSLYTNAPLNILFVFLNVFLIFNNIYFITFCVVTYVIYKKEKRNIMYFAPLLAIILTTISTILSIISLATNIFEIDWAVFFIQLFASLISLFFFFNNYPNIRKKVDLIFDKMLKLHSNNNQSKTGTNVNVENAKMSTKINTNDKYVINKKQEQSRKPLINKTNQQTKQIINTKPTTTNKQIVNNNAKNKISK